MKQIFLFAALSLGLASFGQPQSPLVGTWKLMSSKITSNNTSRSYTASELNSMKIISPTHFAVFGQNSDGTFSHALGGAVTITADLYTESINYGSFPDMKGKKSVFKYEVKDDKMRTWGGVDGTTFDEVWVRVK